MSSLPELLKVFEEASRQEAINNSEQAYNLFYSISVDPACPKQLKMTADKAIANIEKKWVESKKEIKPEPKEEKHILKDNVHQVDIFALESVPALDGAMPIAQEQYDRLKESIRKRGIHTPLFATLDFKLLCGYNRLKIAKELGLKTIPVIFKDIPHKDILEFAIRDNLDRRHMSLQEIAQFISESTTHGTGRPKKHSRAKTVKDIANTLGVSTKTVQRAKTFIKKVQESPELAGKSIKSVVEGAKPATRVIAGYDFTVGVDLDEENLSNSFADLADKIFGFNLNNGDRIKIRTQIWHVKRK